MHRIWATARLACFNGGVLLSVVGLSLVPSWRSRRHLLAARQQSPHDDPAHHHCSEAAHARCTHGTLDTHSSPADCHPPHDARRLDFHFRPAHDLVANHLPSGVPLPLRCPVVVPRNHPYATHSTHSSISSTSSSATLFEFPAPMPYPSHTRSMSHADAATRSKRLSLNFPVHPAGGLPEPRSSRPASWVSSPATSPELLPTPLPAVDGNFFVALAAQERRVLELREELGKAEERLMDLKKQWASHESFGKRRDSRGLHQMQPINTNLASMGAIDDDSSFSLQREMERRKALLNGVRQSNRKVFSGSRHTRTLSLLSPDKASHTPSFPAVSGPPPSDSPIKFQKRARSTTQPEAPDDITKQVGEHPDLPGLQREALLRTGKQMATDFKDGLWTFIEDLRQATVGDEGVNGTYARSPSGQPLRRQTSNSPAQATGLSRSKSLNAARKSTTPHPSGDGSSLIDIESSFWREHGIEEPKPVVTTKPAGMAPRSTPAQQTLRTQASQEFEESWDMWETPGEKLAAAPSSGHNSSNNSISDGRTSPYSERSSPRTSTSSARLHAPTSPVHSKRNSLPWSNFPKLSPSGLKHSVSNLMDEWERSITSPPAPATPALAEVAEASALEDYITFGGAEGKASKGE